MPHRHLLLHDLKRFAVEALCLLLMLQGFPAQALPSAQPAAVEESTETSDTQDDEGVLETAQGWIEQATESTHQALDQPWSSALGLMLGLSAYAVPQDEAPAELAEDTPPAASDEAPEDSPAEIQPPETLPTPGLDALDPASQLRVATKARPADRLAINKVQRKARRVEASTLPPTGPARAPAPQPAKRRSKSIAPEITALAESLNGSPAAILRHVHDTIHYDPGHGADSPPLGTLWEGRGTAWDQAWLLQELLLAAGVDARLEWGEIEITPDLLTALAGVDDPIRAADLLTTAGVPIVLVIGGSQIIAARMPHVWVKAHLDFIPDRGIKHGTPDQWIRMDPTLKDHPVIEGQRTDDEVFFVLADHLQSGTEKSPRQEYEEDLLDHAGSSDLDALKPLRTLKEERFPFVPGTLRAKILSIDGLAETVPTSKQVSLEVKARAAGGAQLFTWTTPLPAIYGKALELRWPGATSADQANLDLYGGIHTTPPYEIELAAELALDGSVVKSGGAIGAAEDVELTAKITPPGSVGTHARWDLFAGEHAVLGFDRGRAPQQIIDRHSQRAASATDADSQETYRLAAAGATYLHHLGEDLDHLGALRWHRVVPLGTAVLAVQRGAVSTFPNGSPETFSRGPLSLELGAMPLGLFPADGVQVGTVRTLELLGSQTSVREGEALATIFGGEHPTAVGFLKQAVREGQALTRVDNANLETTLAAVELGEDAEASVRDAIAQGKIAWVAESQLDINGWDTSGYVILEPGSGLGGGSGQYSVTFERLITALGGAVTFHSPQDLDIVTAPTDVVASIDAEGLQSWTLSTRPAGSSTGDVIASGTGPVDSATLGQFDPTLLLNGLHELILTGTDAAGQTVSGKVAVSVEGQMKIGHFTLSFIDLAIPVSGLDIEVVRTYDSRQRLERDDFGQGWSLDIREGSYRNNRPPGDGWQIPGTAGPWGLPCSTVHETKSHLTTVRLSDQEVYRFRLTLRNPATVIGGCYADAVFEWVDGPLPGTTLEVLGETQVFVATGSNRAVLPDTQEPFVPEDVKLTTRDGRIFHLDLTEGVTHVEDLNGNYLEITPEGITHSSGKGIEFERDGEGRITRITDPMGHSNTYEYDAAGDLVGFTDRVDATTHFTYKEGHYLEDIENALGVRAVRTEYDANGRVVRMIDAAGKVVQLKHELDARRETITNRLGFVRVLEYDERGNVILATDEEGHRTTFTYDSKDRPLTIVNALGHVTSYAYDADGDLTSARDPLGRTTRFTYDSRGHLLSAADARGKVTTHTYSVHGDRLSTRNPLGHEAVFAYDSAGHRTHQSDATGATTQMIYDGNGYPTRIIGPLGHATDLVYDASGNLTRRTIRRTLPDGTTETSTTTFVLDPLGRRIETLHPDGSRWRTTYDALGAIVAQQDPLGHVTRLTYDALGRQTATLFPDGSQEGRGYDAEGRLLTMADRSGRVTHFTYDKKGQQLSTTYADGSSTRTTYNAVGQTVSSTNARGAVTTYAHDAVGQVIEVVDALGHRKVYDYDAVGQQVALRDALGHVTRFEYDDAGRTIKTILPDGQATRLEYDARGLRTAELDQAGLRTEMAYDAAGRMIAITDALGGTARYDYDEEGNLIARIDANGHAVRFEYDALGRQTARVLADGARESFVYDAVGRRIRQTDFNGSTTQLAYDSGGRLIRKTRPGGATFETTYTPTGRRSTVVGPRGTTTYHYDARDRLTRISVPEGYALHYRHDNAGNRTATTTELADGTMFGSTFTYDLLDRLETVTDSRGGVYSLAYDAVGSRESLTYPNGVVTTYGHDSVRRLQQIRVEDPAAEVLLSHTYERGVTGRRQAVSDHEGTLWSYSYDPLFRLIEEQVTDAGGQPVYQNRFTYDPVGNRLAQERLVEGSPFETIVYTYDQRDRLLSETSALRDVSYTWGAQGHRLSRAGTTAEGSVAGESYTWDGENRLSGVQLADGSEMALRYDVDGTWQGFSLTGGPDPGQEDERTWVVDPARGHSQILGQLNGEGKLEAGMVRAAEPLAWLQPDTESYLHGDLIGSILASTDASGAIAGRHAYDAFGTDRATAPGPLLPLGFAGEQRATPSELYYLRARWLDPRSGSLLSLDPMAHQPNLLGYQPYGYADQDPINRIDPSGRVSVGVVAIGVTVAAAVGVAVASFVIPRGPSRLGPSGVKTIRPIILEDPKVPWTDSEVNLLLSHGRDLLAEQSQVSYSWGAGTIRRLRNYEVIGNRDGKRHIITPSIESAMAAKHLIYHLWLEAPNSYPVIFVTGLNFRPGANGLTVAEEFAPTWRGSLITRESLRSYPELAVAHEIVHGFGLVDDRRCAGALGYLMSKGPCGFGRRLTVGEAANVWVNSLALR